MTVAESMQLSEVADSLGLAECDGDLFFGRITGFAVGFQVIDPQGLPLLLFQVRHPLAADAAELKTVRYSPEISRLMADKKLDIEFDRQIAWLTFVDAFDLLQRGEIKKLLKEILDSFATAGLAKNANLCHYCQTTPVDALSCWDGKVLQICPGCLAKRTAPAESVPAVAGNVELMPMVLFTALAGVAGAAAWAVCWILYEVFFLTGSNVIFLKLEALVAVGTGAATGCPVGFVIRRFRRRGRRISYAIAGIFSLLAALLGELAFVTWLIYREYHVVEPGGALKVLPRVELASDPYHVISKVLALVVALAFAIGLAKPAAKPKPNF